MHKITADGNSFGKIASIVEIKKLGLPTPETVFVFDAKKQDSEIENFLRDRELVMIRSDKKGGAGNARTILPARKARQRNS